MGMINKYSHCRSFEMWAVSKYLTIPIFFCCVTMTFAFFALNAWRRWCHLSELYFLLHLFLNHITKNLRTVLLSSCMAFCTERTDATVPRPPFDGYYRINLPDLGPQGVADHLFSIYSSAFIVFYDTRLKNNVVFQIVSDHHSLVFCLRSVIMVYTHTASLNLLYLNIFKNTIQINTTYDLLHIYSMFCEICHASVGVFWLINKQKNEQSKHTSVKFKIPSIPRMNFSPGLRVIYYCLWYFLEYIKI